MLESVLERKCCKMAEMINWRNHKLKDGDGVPDRIFTKGTFCFYVEFKQKGKKPKPHQLTYKKSLEVSGDMCFIVDSLEKFKQCLKEVETRRITNVNPE